MAPQGPESEVSLRAVIVFLKSPYGGAFSAPIIQSMISKPLSIAQINTIYRTAQSRGFDPNAPKFAIKDEFIINSPRSGRPSKQDDATTQLVIAKVVRDRFGREKSCADIAGDLEQELGIEISQSTVWRILRKNGYNKTKPTRKPGLTKAMRADRLKFALDHKDWTLEDWKDVIWSDETSVLLGHRRGGYRVWRKSNEAFVKSCIRERWKGFMEFMFWGCFSYDKKGPCHIFGTETAAQKKSANEAIERLNEELEPIMKAQWQLNSGLSRLGLRNKRGKKPQWNWNKASGKLVRDNQKGGIDWWRYQSEILIPKLLPFAKACLIDRPNTVVQEDKAPSHSHSAQHKIYNLWAIMRLIWPGNSPDLNAIEPTWYWMKRRTTSKGAPTTRKAATELWLHWWRELPQENIQAWIERIPHHIQEIIRLEGGNEYKEGRAKLFDGRLAQLKSRRNLEELEEELSEEDEWYDCDE